MSGPTRDELAPMRGIVIGMVLSLGIWAVLATFALVLVWLL